MLPLGLGETIFDPDFYVLKMPATITILGVKVMLYLEYMNTHWRYIGGIYEKNFGAVCAIPVPEKTTPVYTRFFLMKVPVQYQKNLKDLVSGGCIQKQLPMKKRYNPILQIDRILCSVHPKLHENSSHYQRMRGLQKTWTKKSHKR